MAEAAGQDRQEGHASAMKGDHRDNIFEFFRSHTAYDMLPESGKVLLLDGTMSAYSALRVMAANQQLAVPVWDGRRDVYLGMLTASDILELVLLCSNSDSVGNLTESMRAITLEHWIASCARPPGCPEVSVEIHPDDDLICVLRTLVRNDCRVLPVLDRDGNNPLLNQCIVGQVTYLLLFRFLYYHQESDLATLEGTLGDVGIGTLGEDKLITVRASEQLATAITLMSKHRISGIPVLDDSGKFVDMFCDSDVLGLKELDLGIDLTNALQQARESQPKLGTTCQIDDPLAKVVSCFSSSKSTRLACLDAEGRVKGVVTLTDLFKFLAGA
mmetsp:Transcript_53480/g.109060  ORF Transcript_53480/g.109060 Transcript_53480/m.109060 type:complete len:329 (+) Transcript_53480:496-1482(+)|eukprot:CAMPEP_0181300338 /NCGR_PEP_ID=MMETSP1101-20121128/6835_1 /TAXON_ID=46948 /ORGANISM="Rhodomonas abbreviata, Strain Caron Lab Isolate" /LENGTH=328 /DNA_ID=CAMNT_0023405565 /DNA_START=80 /DNA_END=1066 /DNA_ORIENTATION=+